MPNRLRAAGPTQFTLWFDTAAFAKLRTDEREHCWYHLQRMMTGEATAESE